MFHLLRKCFSLYPLRAWFSALGAGSLGVAFAGLQLQGMLSLAPCPYCIFQRLLYLLIGLLALAGFLLPAASVFWLGAIILLAVSGFGVAAYQSWMQAYPDLAPECSFTDPDLIERLVDMLGMQWPSLFLATGFCSSKEWVFLGLSMANWSALFFLGVIVYALVLIRHPGR
jgi:disulfide bond formation protein DsbB